MSYQTDRDNFFRYAGMTGLPEFHASKLLRLATTANRVNTAACNGDYPADNGERKTKECPSCACHWAPASFARSLCPSCRNDDLARKVVADLPGWAIEFNGDPRGYPYTLTAPDGRKSGVPCRG